MGYNIICLPHYCMAMSTRFLKECMHAQLWVRVSLAGITLTLYIQQMFYDIRLNQVAITSYAGKHTSHSTMTSSNKSSFESYDCYSYISDVSTNGICV